MRRTIVPLVLLMLLLAASQSWSATSLEDILSSISPAVGALYAQRSDGSLSFLCSITIIGKTDRQTELLTAKHCVEKDVAYLVTFDGKLFYAARVWKLPGEDIDPNKYRRQYGEATVDAAIFAVDQVLDLPVVPLGSDVGVAPGRSIVTVGFPLGATKIRYVGIVAGRYERPGSEMDGYLILQIFGSPGSSGTAIIEEASGTVIGILVSGRQSFGTPVIFATPVSYLRFLMEVPRQGGARLP